MPSAADIKAAEEKLQLRDRCKTDKLFLAQMLGYDFQPDVHAELFNTYLTIKPGVTLQEQDTVKDRMVLWSRGHYKTYSIHVEAIQLILNFPDIRIMLMKGKVSHSQQLLAAIRAHFLGEAHGSRLAELFPEFCVGKKGSSSSWTTSARVRKNQTQPTIAVASPRALKTGEHFDVGFFDDLVHENNFRNPELVQRAIDDFNHYTPLIDPGGYKYVTGTRYTFDDLYGWITKKNEETHSWAISLKKCWTVDDHGNKHVVFPQRKLKDGRLIGFTLEMLLQIQNEDPEMFSCQYLHEPTKDNTQRFTRELMLRQVKTIKDETTDSQGNSLYPYPEHSPTIMMIDLASSKMSHADHSVVIVGRIDHLNRTWITDCRGDRYETHELAAHVIDMALIHRPLRILVEGTSAGKMFVEIVKMKATALNIFLPIEPLKIDVTDGAKRIRISSLVGELLYDALFFLSGLPNWNRILKEFVEYSPGKKHDDYPDTIALLVNFFRDNIPRRRAPTLADHPMFRQQPTNPAVQPFDNERANDMGSNFNC